MNECKMNQLKATITANVYKKNGEQEERNEGSRTHRTCFRQKTVSTVYLHLKHACMSEQAAHEGNCILPPAEMQNHGKLCL